MNYQGFVIEPMRHRGQWQIRVKKADGSQLRTAIPGQPDEVASEWLSSLYMSKEDAIERIKRWIDAGGCV